MIEFGIEVGIGSIRVMDAVESKQKYKDDTSSLFLLPPFFFKDDIGALVYGPTIDLIITAQEARQG